MGLKLIPVYNLQAVLNTWYLYVDGIEAVLRNSGDDTNIEKIYNEIMAGNLLLWVGLLDGVYAGFLTTCFQEIPMSGRSLWIVHTFKCKKVPTDFLLEGLEIVEKFAREKNCKRLKFYAIRKPWIDKLERLGFKEGYTEFIREVAEQPTPGLLGPREIKNEDLPISNPQS